MNSNLNHPNQQRQQEIIFRDRTPSNGVGIAGFVISIVGFFIGWIPVWGWVIWIVGLVLSSVGMYRRPRGLAIAGLVISLVSVLFILFVFSAIIAAVSLA